jgi:hypothetical protein
VAVTNPKPKEMLMWTIVPQIVKDCEVNSKIINFFPIEENGETRFKRIAPVIQICIKNDASDGVIKLKWTRRGGFVWQSPEKMVQPTIRRGTKWFPDPDKPAKLETPEPKRFAAKSNFIQYLQERVGDLTATILQEFALRFEEIGAR